MSEDKKKEKVSLNEFLKTDRAVLIIAMSIAFVFWFVTKMSKDAYYSSKTCKIIYDLPEGKTLARAATKSVKIKVKGTGWRLLRLSLQKSPKLRFTLNSDNYQTISANQIIRKLSRDYGDNLSILTADVDVISLQLDDAAQKRVPILLDYSLDFLPYVNLVDEPSISPDSVTLYGPSAEIENITTWQSSKLELSNVNEDINKTISLLKPASEQIALSAASIKVFADVEQMTEGVIDIPIKVKNTVDSVLFFPPSVTLKYIVSVKAFDKVSFDDFEVVADFKQIKSDKEAKTIALEITNTPKQIKSSRLDKVKVDFYIIK